MFYNEFDSFAASWLRNLIAAGELPEGVVDERSIEELGPEDCRDTSHFFAGIGGWPYALALAGWPSDAPVWTGSCPCQPFSAAGRREGADDARHLWPAFFGLIEKCRPPVIFGEQVANGDGRQWLAGVRADLEALGYAVGAADLCAASSGAPHIRQRMFWVAESESLQLTGAKKFGDGPCEVRGAGADEAPQARRGSDAGRLADYERQGLEGLSGHGCRSHEPGREQAQSTGRLGDTEGERRCEARSVRPVQRAARPSVDGTPWDEHDIAWCDERPLGRGWVPRRVEPGSFPLAHGLPARVGRLRGYGNAIVPQLGALFVRSFMEVQKGGK